MPSKPIYTEVDGRKLKLSNTDKLLYSGVGVTKAEVIQYYLQVAAPMLKHINRRPLTLIRFPDGAEGKRFYSKNKPKWTPDWVASTLVGDDEENHYLLANEQATLVWLANLAALEIHPMNVRSPNLQFPDQFIFDLDPSEQFDFDDLKLMAKQLKEHVESYGYNTFIKTSGGKGLHIYLPIQPIYHRDVVYKALQDITKEFVVNHKETTTLTVSKEKRKGKVFIDILRNRSSNSCVAPYSLRGKPGAPVSMPFPWAEIDSITSPQLFTIRSAVSRLQEKGDAWETIWEQATPLHNQGKQAVGKLNTYNQKRDFKKTTEPTATDQIKTSGKDYAVQLHDASNLHYDLRLEKDGVLLSWAVPKGLPHQPGVKRLAIQTEDHPLKYLHFEGEIPKGEYGGGTMWVFDQGTYEIIKSEKKKLHFRLLKGDLAGEYVLYNTKEKQWIIELKSEKNFAIEDYKKPMLANLATSIPTSDYFYEIKWDGIRAIFFIQQGELTIYSRNGNDITKQFPELQIITKQIEAEIAIIDAEIVHLDEKGRPLFANIVGRIHTVGEQSIVHAAKKTPATAYLFDLLYLDGKDCRSNGNLRRRMWLEAILTPGERIRFSDSFEEGEALFQAIAAQKMEGIICKAKDGWYSNGKRSDHWLKVKVRNEDTAYIIGYTKGEGDRNGLIGALHVAKKEDGKLKYYGKVGTGFTVKRLKEIQQQLDVVPRTEKPISDTIEKEYDSTWIEPTYQCEIEYASFTPNGTYREPVFKRLIDE